MVWIVRSCAQVSLLLFAAQGTSPYVAQSGGLLRTERGQSAPVIAARNPNDGFEASTGGRVSGATINSNGVTGGVTQHQSHRHRAPTPAPTPEPTPAPTPVEPDDIGEGESDEEGEAAGEEGEGGQSEGRGEEEGEGEGESGGESEGESAGENEAGGDGDGDVPSPAAVGGDPVVSLPVPAPDGVANSDIGVVDVVDAAPSPTIAGACSDNSDCGGGSFCSAAIPHTCQHCDHCKPGGDYGMSTSGDCSVCSGSCENSDACEETEFCSTDSQCTPCDQCTADMDAKQGKCSAYCPS